MTGRGKRLSGRGKELPAPPVLMGRKDRKEYKDRKGFPVLTAHKAFRAYRGLPATMAHRGRKGFLVTTGRKVFKARQGTTERKDLPGLIRLSQALKGRKATPERKASRV